MRNRPSQDQNIFEVLREGMTTLQSGGGFTVQTFLCNYIKLNEADRKKNLGFTQ